MKALPAPAIASHNRVHTLKAWPRFFQAVEHGRKPFEVRLDDSHSYQVGDLVTLNEWDPDRGCSGAYTYRHLTRRVSYVMRLADVTRFWPPEQVERFGLVVLGLESVDTERERQCARQNALDEGFRVGLKTAEAICLSLHQERHDLGDAGEALLRAIQRIQTRARP